MLVVAGVGRDPEPGFLALPTSCHSVEDDAGQVSGIVPPQPASQGNPNIVRQLASTPVRVEVDGRLIVAHHDDDVSTVSHRYFLPFFSACLFSVRRPFLTDGLSVRPFRHTDRGPVSFADPFPPGRGPASRQRSARPAWSRRPLRSASEEA